MIKRKFHIFVVSFILTLILPFSVQAEESPSIAELIEKAEPGDVVELENRLYEEDVVIDKAITLVGKEDTTIKGSGTGDVVTLDANGIVLENIRITGSGTVLDHDHAGVKILSDDTIVKNTIIDDSLHGIYVKASKGNILQNNVIKGKTDLNPSRRGNGIHLFHSSYIEILDNTITDARDGIYFSFANHSFIEGNKISKTRYGLHYMYSDYNEFYRNEFYENTGGAAIMYSDFIRLEENQFYDHHELQSFGVLFQTANDVEMKNNVIRFNQKGIFMDQSNRNMIKNNQVTNNRVALDIWSSSIDNVFTGNHFIDNILQYTSDGGKDRNNWNDGKVGNAWSDHLFIDLDEDGISDGVYQYTSAFGDVLVREQLGVLFLDSPALALYENWNELLNPNDVKISDVRAIHVATSTGGMHYFLPVVTVLILLVILRRNRREA